VQQRAPQAIEELSDNPDQGRLARRTGSKPLPAE